MCVILEVPPGVKVSRETLEICYDNNPHGWGIMWHEPTENKIWYAKDTTSFEKFWATWKDVPEDTPRGVHFRIKTHGKVDRDNCHPFFISHNLGLMHNGVLDVEEANQAFSDTWHFVEFDLKPLLQLSDTSLLQPGMPLGEVIEDFVNTGSRLLFMDNLGETRRFGKSWHEENGVFYSNSYSHKAKKHTYTTFKKSDAYDDYWQQRANHSYKAPPLPPPPPPIPLSKDLELIAKEVSQILTEEEKAEGIELLDIEFDTYDKANKYRKENGGFVRVSKGVFTVCNTRVKVPKETTSEVLKSVTSLTDFSFLSDVEKLEYIKTYPEDTLDLIYEAII